MSLNYLLEKIENLSRKKFEKKQMGRKGSQLNARPKPQNSTKCAILEKYYNGTLDYSKI